MITNRLVLREWVPSDRVSFAEMNADPRVMRYFPAPLTRKESDALVDHVEAHFEKHGFGPWAVEIPGVTEFAGFIGLSVPNFVAHFTPCVEIGWRLAVEHWGQGYATEGASAVLDYAFNSLQLHEVVSFTTKENRPSRRVMERIGMVYDESGDFEHPNLAEGHPLRPHVLYRKLNRNESQCVETHAKITATTTKESQ